MSTVAELYELSEDSPVYQLVERFTEAVSKRTGRPSRWNGVILVDPSAKPKTVGLAYSDGHITLSGPIIVDRLLRAYADEPVPDDDLDKILNAAATIAHEVGHLDNRDGQDPDGHPVDDASAEALDEGLMERWTWDNLDDLLHETGLAEQVPGLVGRDRLDEYPAYTAAVDDLLVGLEPLTGRRPDELAAELRATDRSQRWNRIAELAIAHEVPELPDGQWAEARSGLADCVRQRFSEAHAIQEDKQRTPQQKRIDGGHVGVRTVTLLDAELERISHQVARDRPAYLADRVQPTQTTATADALAARPAPAGPPGFATADPVADPATDPAAPSARPVSAAEMEHLNGLLAAQQPAARTRGSGPANGSRPGTARVGTGREQPTRKAGGRG